jgi:hypothetical protein
VALPPHSAEHHKTSIKEEGCPDEPSTSCFNGLEEEQQFPARRISAVFVGSHNHCAGRESIRIMLVTNRWHKEISVEGNTVEGNTNDS